MFGIDVLKFLGPQTLNALNFFQNPIQRTFWATIVVRPSTREVVFILLTLFRLRHEFDVGILYGRMILMAIGTDLQRFSGFPTKVFPASCADHMITSLGLKNKSRAGWTISTILTKQSHIFENVFLAFVATLKRLVTL